MMKARIPASARGVRAVSRVLALMLGLAASAHAADAPDPAPSSTPPASEADDD